MKAVKIVLHKPSGEAFFGWLRKHTEDMSQRWEASGGVAILVEHDSLLDEWLHPESPGFLPDWMYQVVVWVSFGEPTDDRCVKITFDTFPLNFPSRMEGIEVTAAYEPCNELQEMEGYFLELLEAISLRYPEAVPQLERQGFPSPPHGADDTEKKESGEAEVKSSAEDALGTGIEAEKRRMRFPTTEKARARWSRANQLIVSKREEYKNDLLDGLIDSRGSQIDDLRQALFNDLNRDWRKIPSISTVQRIIKAGRKGWLKPPP